MGNVRTSRVFEAWGVLHARLVAQAWPVDGHQTVTVHLSMPSPVDDISEDQVRVLVVDPSTADWVTLGPAQREEVLAVLVHVQVHGRGRTQVEVRDRLDAICAVVEGALRDQTSGVPLWLLDPPEISLAVVAIVPSIWPTRSGFAGSAEVQVQLKAHI